MISRPDPFTIVDVPEPVSDHGRVRTRWKIEKYRWGEAAPYEVLETQENLLLNEGIALLWDLGIGAGGTVWNNANARLGVGNSSAGESAAQTGLQGASQAYAKMLSGFPSRAAQTVTWKSSYGPDEANFAWNEMCVTNASGTGGQDLNRKVSAQGTKTSGQNWTLQLDVTLT